ncbi:MAG: ribosome biogenesis GTP-binding protein YihA/YsxC [bacterium]
MKITSVEFVKSVVDVAEIPKDNLHEVAFAGRSNVGKSSLINSLLNRKKIAKTSSTPGKTRQLNYFRINNRFYFVDLPGYGYARVSEKERGQWQTLIESYLRKSEKLKGVISIIDSRIGPTPLDLQLLEWLQSLRLPVLLVATKVDKLSKSALVTHLKKFSADVQQVFSGQIIAFSAANGTGKKELLRQIICLVES